MNSLNTDFKRVSISIVFFFYQFLLLGQGQPNSPDEFIKVFENQVSYLHQEKAFIHTDRSSYITGETIWMSLYCLDAALHYSSEKSKVLNIELLNSSGTVVKNARFQLNKGRGKGQIFVSPDIKSGAYTLRAYTNWMKNFDPDFVFQKKLSILNSSVIPSEDEKPRNKNTSIITFFPEGGDLIFGLKSKVAIKMSNDDLDTIVTGTVFDNENNKITTFKTSHLGYSSFWLTPELGKTYFARINEDSLNQKYQLPEIKKSGLVMSVSSLDQGDFKIDLTATQNFSENLYLVIHTRGVISQFTPLNLNIQKSFPLYQKDLQSGISHVTIMDNNFSPLAERLVFKYPKNIQPVNAKFNKNTYAKREKINLLLNQDNTNIGEHASKISLSVFRSDSSSTINDNIISSLLLTSDLKGRIINPWLYFDPKNESRRQQVDLVMMTNGWRRFSWEQISNNKNISIKYPVEKNAPILSGKINRNDQNQLPKSIQTLFPGKASIINSVDLDTDGRFYFEVPFRMGNEAVYFFTNEDDLDSTFISVDSPFNLPFNTDKTLKNVFAHNSKKYLESLNTNIQISQVYRKYNFINGLEPKTQPINTHFYGQPDHLYLLDNYTRFETIKDLFIEYIRSAVIRNRGNQKDIYVIKDRNLMPERALVLIDGVPITDSDYLFDFDPLKIEKLEVINDFYYIGESTYSGIVSFTTYEGDLAQKKMPEYLLENAYYALQNPREFYTPDYTDNNSLHEKTPDFRNTLYWNPDITVRGSESINLEFYASDDTGVYEFEINGISNTGEPIYYNGFFNVEED